MGNETYPYTGPISDTLIANGYTFSHICHKCNWKPVFVKVINGRTIEIKIRGQFANNISTGRTFTELSATVFKQGRLFTVISNSTLTQSVLDAQNLK